MKVSVHKAITVELILEDEEARSLLFLSGYYETIPRLLLNGQSMDPESAEKMEKFLARLNLILKEKL